MFMKIINKNDKPLWTMQLECTGKGYEYENGNKGYLACGSTLEIDANDIIFKKVVSWGDEVDCCYSVKCPCCNCITRIPPEKLPDAIKYYAQSNKKSNNQKKDNGVER